MGGFAAKLIEDAGLKGLTVGGAQVSQLHSGFIINLGGASAHDVLELIAQVQKRVFDHSGIMLEPEVRIVGEGG
jgi:UDP-N-acetylmuramate dehydrogenase